MGHYRALPSYLITKSVFPKTLWRQTVGVEFDGLVWWWSLFHQQLHRNVSAALMYTVDSVDHRLTLSSIPTDARVAGHSCPLFCPSFKISSIQRCHKSHDWRQPLQRTWQLNIDVRHLAFLEKHGCCQATNWCRDSLWHSAAKRHIQTKVDQPMQLVMGQNKASPDERFQQASR